MAGASMTTFRVGVDIGGTFTDIVFLASTGERFTRKVPSTVDDYSRAITEGIAQVLDERSSQGDSVIELLHGTTVASNAILEMKGARTGLITTKGFRDVLEIRTLRMPRLYDISWTKPPPLVERYLRLEVDERINSKGEVERPLDEQAVEAVVQKLLDEKVEAIAVCLLHSYMNPEHEVLIKRVVSRMAPHMTLCISADVLPEIKEYERTSTTVINAYVRPIVERYLKALIAELQTIGVRAPVLLMQSNGGLTTAQSAAVTPMNIIESGPAAGVVGVQALVRQIGLQKAISFDMGGTTAKASLIEDGELLRAAEYSVGGGIMIGSRLLTGAGYTLKVPAIDLAEVGAGGGSIIWTDAGGALQIGPQSAGASPGPACYDMGGTEPTITDANVVLGYLNPEHLAGGSVRLNAAKSREALNGKIASRLGMSVEQAAYGAHLIAASNMMRAIKAVSSERARDPREFALVGFGGNGPIFAASMARALSMRTAIIPESAGVFSCFGLLASDVEYHFSRTFRGLVRTLQAADVEAEFAALEEKARSQLAADGFTADRIVVQRSVSLRYFGQWFELDLPIPSRALDAATLSGLEEGFGAEHERTYGHRAGAEEPVELVTLRAVGRGVPDADRLPPPVHGVVVPKPTSRRQAYFGPEFGWQDTLVCGRDELAASIAGPCVVEEYDSTTVIPPGCSAMLDSFRNIVITTDMGAA
jgi:N-methylhydantoinase A